MIRNHKSAMVKFSFFVASLLLLGFSTLLPALPAEKQDQEPAAPAFDEQAFVAKFTDAKALFFKEKYDQALLILQKLSIQIAKEPDRDTLKGEVFLVTGATHEKLHNKPQAFSYFCMAKQLLGKGKSIEGLDLSKYKQYKKECPLKGGA